MRRSYHRFENAGVALAVVGQGTPGQSAEFIRSLRLPYPVLTDPERTAYAAFGLVAGGAKAFVNLATGRAVLRAVEGGAGVGRVVGVPRECGSWEAVS